MGFYIPHRNSSHAGLPALCCRPDVSAILFSGRVRFVVGLWIGVIDGCHGFKPLVGDLYAGINAWVSAGVRTAHRWLETAWAICTIASAPARPCLGKRQNNGLPHRTTFAAQTVQSKAGLFEYRCGVAWRTYRAPLGWMAWFGARCWLSPKFAGVFGGEERSFFARQIG